MWLSKAFNCVAIVVALLHTADAYGDGYEPDLPRGSYVDVNITSNVPEARLINAATGQILGTTPFIATYTKRTYPFNGDVASLIVEREGYVPVVKIVVIDKWGQTRREATERQNAFYFHLQTLKGICQPEN